MLLPTSPSNLRFLNAFGVALILSLTIARADQTWTGTSGTGGDGTWDAGHTAAWNGNQVWAGGDDQAIFSNTPGTVTVDDSFGNVVTDQLYFAAPAGNYVFTGDTIYTTADSDNPVYAAGNNAANVAIGNDFNLTVNPNNNGQHFQNYGSGVLSLNGNITLNGVAGEGSQQIYFDAGSGSQLEINGTVSANNVGAEADFGFGGGSSGAVYVLGPNVNFTSSLTGGVNIYAGTLLLQTSNVGHTITPEYGGGGPVNILTDAALDYTGEIFVRAGNNAVIGGNTAEISSFSGLIHDDDDSPISFTEVANGRVTFNGDVAGTLSSAGLVKTGDGTVVISGGANGTAGNGLSFATAGAVAADLQAGTTLITNGTGSAFGSGTGVVNVEAGATLGGNGISLQAVVAKDGTSVIAPGDAGSTSLGIAPTIGTLTLFGGLSTTDSNGLTMDFKLDGFTNDVLETPSLTLNGTINMDFSAIGAGVEVDNPYRVIFGVVDAEGDPHFEVSGPTGYELDKSYNGGLGYDYDGSSFTVEFEAIPEPSTYALLGLGLVALVAIGRFRRLSA